MNIPIGSKAVPAIVLCALSAAAAAERGQARLQSTQEGAGLSGTVRLEETKGGLRIDAEITQAPPGKHGFHIHEFGVCDNRGESAGTHYNPDKHAHGDLLKQGLSKTHAGDFGNIDVDSTGQGSFHAEVKGLSLNGNKHPVAGRAFIVHEQPDDFGQPTGNAGKRIACGPILVVKD